MEILELYRDLYAYVPVYMGHPNIATDSFEFLQKISHEGNILDPMVVFQNNSFKKSKFLSETGVANGYAVVSATHVLPKLVKDSLGAGTFYVKTNASATAFKIAQREDTILNLFNTIVTGAKTKQKVGKYPWEKELWGKAYETLEVPDMGHSYPAMLSFSEFLPLILGTLGGPENFIEVRRQERSDKTWVIVHYQPSFLAEIIYLYYLGKIEDRNVHNHMGEGFTKESLLGQTYLREVEFFNFIARTLRAWLAKLVLVVLEKILKTDVKAIRTFDTLHTDVCAVSKGILHRVGTTKLTAEHPVPLLTDSGSFMYFYRANLDNIKNWGNCWGCIPNGTGRSLGLPPTSNALSNSYEDLNRSVSNTLSHDSKYLPANYQVISRVEPLITDYVHSSSRLSLIPMINFRALK
jgi:hypothetical protein